MTNSELIIYLWLVPVALQIVIPLVLFSSWAFVSAVKRLVRIFISEDTLSTQLAKA